MSTINPIVVIIAMINGMIGGLILVLPLLTIQAGTLLSFIVILVTGVFSFYSCYLCVIHLGNLEDLDKAVFYHFGKSKVVRIFYDFMVFSNLILLLFLYFNLIVQQWYGLIPVKTVINPICNAVFLLLLTCLLKYVHFGAKLLGYGIISIIMYCIFLIWVAATEPSGEKTIPLFGTGAVNLAASMGQAFSIQTFFIPVLRELPFQQTKNYPKYTLYAYIVGGLVYLYIAFAGGFGVLNRHDYQSGLQTIEAYFPSGQWQVGIVEGIYLVHLYSAFGEFLIVCKKRFFSMFSYCGYQQSKESEMFKIPEFIFVFIIIALTLVIFFTAVPISVLIQINGAVVGFFFIYFIPAAMHFKCVYVDKKYDIIIVPIEKPRQTQMIGKKIENEGLTVVVDKYKDINELQQNLNQLNRQENEFSASKQESLLDKSNITNNQEKQVQALQEKQVNALMHIEPEFIECPCRKPKNIGLQVLDLFGTIGMTLLGLFIMVNGIISVIKSP